MEKEFLSNAKKFHEYHLKNHIKSANKYAKKMHKILNNIVKTDYYEIFLDNILSSGNDVAIIWVCAVCIDRNYREDEAINILKNLTTSEDKIISRDANMLLAVKLK